MYHATTREPVVPGSMLAHPHARPPVNTNVNMLLDLTEVPAAAPVDTDSFGCHLVIVADAEAGAALGDGGDA